MLIPKSENQREIYQMYEYVMKNNLILLGNMFLFCNRFEYFGK